MSTNSPERKKSIEEVQRVGHAQKRRAIASQHPTNLTQQAAGGKNMLEYVVAEHDVEFAVGKRQILGFEVDGSSFDASRRERSDSVAGHFDAAQPTPRRTQRRKHLTAAASDVEERPRRPHAWMGARDVCLPPHVFRRDQSRRAPVVAIVVTPLLRCGVSMGFGVRPDHTPNILPATLASDGASSSRFV